MLLNPNATLGRSVTRSGDSRKNPGTAVQNHRLSPGAQGPSKASAETIQRCPFSQIGHSGRHPLAAPLPSSFQCQIQYVFHHNQNNGSLFMTFYQYFLLRWNDPAIPEFDFETGELVLPGRIRNMTGKRKSLRVNRDSAPIGLEERVYSQALLRIPRDAPGGSETTFWSEQYLAGDITPLRQPRNQI